eukprot:scaffold30408_cov53-Attheya_sp.AAC.2
MGRSNNSFLSGRPSPVMAMVLVASVTAARSWVPTPRLACFSTLASRNYRQQLDLAAREPWIQSSVRLFGSSGNDGDISVNEKNENNKKKKPEIWRALQTQPLAPLFPSFDEYTFPSPIDDMLTDLPVGQRIVSFGDVHGDIQALRGFLVTAKVMDPKSSVADPKWIGGDTICVQTGDILDRGDDELACLRVLASLARQAKDAGGSLTVLYGNHESLNAAGMFHYTNPGGNQEIETDIGYTVDSTLGTDRWRLQFAGNQPARWAAFEPAHHGENNNIGAYESTEEVIDDAQKRAKAAASTMPDCLGGGNESSPVWMRDYSSPPDKEPSNRSAQAMIDACLQKIGPDMKRMVMGHTPQAQINAALKGKAWRIDMGASKGVYVRVPVIDCSGALSTLLCTIKPVISLGGGGIPEVLEIIHGEIEDEINILTVAGGKVNGKERQIVDQFLF